MCSKKLANWSWGALLNMGRKLSGNKKALQAETATTPKSGGSSKDPAPPRRARHCPTIWQPRPALLRVATTLEKKVKGIEFRDHLRKRRGRRGGQCRRIRHFSAGGNEQFFRNRVLRGFPGHRTPGEDGQRKARCGGRRSRTENQTSAPDPARGIVSWRRHCELEVFLACGNFRALKRVGALLPVAFDEGRTGSLSRQDAFLCQGVRPHGARAKVVSHVLGIPKPERRPTTARVGQEQAALVAVPKGEAALLQARKLLQGGTAGWKPASQDPSSQSRGQSSRGSSQTEERKRERRGWWRPRRDVNVVPQPPWFACGPSPKVGT